MIQGRWRVYSNAAAEWPLVWSIDNGDPETETKLRGVIINGRGVTVYQSDGKGLPAQPKAWVEVEGKMEIDGQVATIWGAVHVRQAHVHNQNQNQHHGPAT